MYSGTLLFGGFLGRAVLHQLNAEHQPFAANLADQIVLLRQFIEPTDQMISYLQSILLQVFAIDYLEHRSPLCTDHWISAEGIKMDSFGETLRDRRRGDYCRQRNPVSDPFRHGHDVGYHPLTFKSPVGFAGAAKTSLDFVRDADTAGASHMFIHMLEIVVREQNRPANSLNRFRNKSCDSAGCGIFN